MLSKLKGFSSEDFFSTIMVSILIMVFLFGVLKGYESYIQKIDIEEQEIQANTIAKKIFFENSGVIGSPEKKFELPERGIKIILRDKVKNLNYTSGNETYFLYVKSQFSSSLPVLLLNRTTGEYSLGILEVYVGK
ncbi:MAG TPA: hypothetical protein VJB06_02565 [archaeon]|nr:hypothetical protein [archaeon]